MKQDSFYLRHIADAIAKIEQYASVGREAFLGQSHWHDAAIRQLEIIGEATKKLSPELKDQHPDIPWRRVAGLRDVLIHDYFGVDLAMIWGVVQKDIPLLRDKIRSILGQMPPGAGNPGQS